MKHFLKIGENLDVMPLLIAIRRRPELWREDTYLRDYPQGPFEQVESIMLRFPVKSVVESQQELEDVKSRYDQHESIDYPPYKLLPEARPLVNFVMMRVSGERLGRVMINKIEPGGMIFPHRDTPEHAAYYSRFHVVIQGQPECQFRCEDEVVSMKTGELWWFNNALEHEVHNDGDDDRIHMIVDVRTSR